jgi:hypothetical protein
MSAPDRAPRVWLLNLDAEHELEAPRGYQPTKELVAIVARQAPKLVGTLVRPGDLVLPERELGAEERARYAGLEGLAWSPTPRARARLEAAGLVVAPTPPLEVLRTVNARPFAAAVRAPLAGASFAKDVATTLEEALALVGRPAALGWLVRRTFGAAGRGRRRLHAGTPAAAERAWLVASLRLGPLVVEPWVAVTREYTRSAWVSPSGALAISAPCFQETTPAGAWTRTERAERALVRREDDTRLEEAVAAAGAALHTAGYAGPFGIDAYRHRTEHGEVLNPLSEINARFTMDWTTAMAEDGRSRGLDARLDALLTTPSTGSSEPRAPQLT